MPRNSTQVPALRPLASSLYLSPSLTAAAGAPGTLGNSISSTWISPWPNGFLTMTVVKSSELGSDSGSSSPVGCGAIGSGAVDCGAVDCGAVDCGAIGSGAVSSAAVSSAAVSSATVGSAAVGCGAVAALGAGAG